MHHEAVILCIDEGTSGTRAAVVGRDGQVSAQDYLPLEIHCPRPGVVEQDADLLLERTLDVCRRAIARAQGSGQQIVALAIANQRCLTLDGHDEVLRHQGGVGVLGPADNGCAIRKAI